MQKLSMSIKIYIGLIAALSVVSAANVFLPQGNFLPMQELPASKPLIAIATAGIMIVVYGGLGFLGLRLSRKLGFADLWDAKISNKQRFLIPGLIGTGIGIVFIITDLIMMHFHNLGPIPHPPFPTSITASASAGIGEEIIFRLFFISFWSWLISDIILKKHWKNHVFWVFTVLSALAFAFSHMPSIIYIFEFKTINEVPAALMIEIIFLNGILSLFAAYYFRKYGFLAAVGIHFWTDIVWHVIRGVF